MVPDSRSLRERRSTAFVVGTQLTKVEALLGVWGRLGESDVRVEDMMSCSTLLQLRWRGL